VVIGVTILALLYIGHSVWVTRVHLEPAKRERAKVDVQAFDKACKAYYTQHDCYPADLGEVVPLLEDGGQGVIDPWGKRYQYHPPADDRNPASPLIFTTAPDGTRISNE
jgi:hypothetical protein